MKLLYYAIKYKGEYHKIKQAIEKNEPYYPITYSGNYITIEDPLYPKSLLNLSNPPFVLFYEGDIALLNKNALCVVGSRLHSEEAIYNVQTLCENDVLFISGLAKGIDGLVHEYAKSSIGVIGCGINIIYPKNHTHLYQKVKLIISEYPNNTLPLKHHFPMRNRIMVALSKIMVIVEIAQKSGTFTSLNLANELGKEIFVFPSSFKLSSKINNELIYEGANSLYNKTAIKDMLEYLNN